MLICRVGEHLRVRMLICGVGEYLEGWDVDMLGWGASDVRFRTSDVDRQGLVVRMLMTALHSLPQSN